MSKKSKIVMGLGLLILVLATAAAAVIWNALLREPGSFPEGEQLMEAMNKANKYIQVEIIEDVLVIDDRTRMIPFITKDDRHGISYWRWERSEWNIVRITNKGTPFLLGLDGDDPDDVYFIWNMHPSDEIDHLKLFFIMNRQYSVTNGTKHRYTPRIQLEHTVATASQIYGISKLPKEWIAVMSSLKKAGDTGAFFDQALVGYIPYDSQGEQQSASATWGGNGAGYSSSYGDYGHKLMQILNDHDLE